MNGLDAKIQAAIVAARLQRLERDMRWSDYLGTVFLAATCTVILMLCIS